jgi:hypothetical protein
VLESPSREVDPAHSAAPVVAATPPHIVTTVWRRGRLVRLAGIEPARRFRAAGFKPAVATDYTTVATPY